MVRARARRVCARKRTQKCSSARYTEASKTVGRFSMQRQQPEKYCIYGSHAAAIHANHAPHCAAAFHPVMLGYAAVAAHLARWLRSPAAKRAQNRLCGGVLMFMGAALLLAGQGAE